MNALENLTQLVKAMEAGSYNAAPSTLVQGAALQTEDLSPVMNNLTFEDKHLHLQQMLKVSACKSTLVQFDRQLSYGQLGGSAQLEGQVGQDETSDYVRIVVPMAYYSHTRRSTIQSNLVATVDGKKAEERMSEDAGKKIAADIEFDLFRGRADFSNAGVFDGNPLMIPTDIANMTGLDVMVRQSDAQKNAQDLMFAEYGASNSVVIAVGGPLTQTNVEDSSVKSAMNWGSADKLLVDPLVLSSYNKIAFGKERIMLAGSPQDATGADLRKQWVSGGVVEVQASRFLSGKTQPAPARSGGPSVPTLTSVTSTTISGTVTSFVSAQVYKYFVTAGNEVGESNKSATVSGTVSSSGDAMVLVITHPSGTFRYFNVYRTLAGGSVAAYIGRVVPSSGSTTSFTDLNNRLPGSVTGFLIQGDTMEIKELSPYTSIKLAVTSLSEPMGYYRFCCLITPQPRKNVLLDSLTA